jgi:hypothetical protein
MGAAQASLPSGNSDAADCGSERRAPRALERFLGACLTLTDLAEPLLQPGGYDRAITDTTRWPPTQFVHLVARPDRHVADGRACQCPDHARHVRGYLP